MVNETLNAAELDEEEIQVHMEEDMEQYLLFQCDDLRVGVLVDYVVETIINTSITLLPMLPSYIPGVMNLRGEVIPVINVRQRLGKMVGEEDSVIVLSLNGIQVGILVDRVDQMVKMSKKNILPMPATNNQKLMCGMATLPDGGTMLVLDSLAMLEI